FTRYATESVSFFDLAKWLNGLGIRNSFGNLYQGRDISMMLTDEAYLGYPTYSKRRTGRFHRYDADGPNGGIAELEPRLRGTTGPTSSRAARGCMTPSWTARRGTESSVSSAAGTRSPRPPRLPTCTSPACSSAAAAARRWLPTPPGGNTTAPHGTVTGTRVTWP